MKRFIGGLLSLVTLISLTTTTFANELTSGNPTGDVPVELTQEASSFSVTVPTALPVDVDSDGHVTVATDNKIINNSYGPVEIKFIEVIPQNTWKLVDFNTNFKDKEVGLKEFGFKLNDSAVELDGSCAAEFEVIPGNSELSFTYDANVATQKAALADVEIAQVVFVIGWVNAIQGYEIVALEDIIDEDGVAHLNVGQSVQLEVVALYSDEPIHWKSSASFLSVTQDGIVTAGGFAPAYQDNKTAKITYTMGDFSDTLIFQVHANPVTKNSTPGVYGIDGVMIYSWAESGINVSKDYNNEEGTANYYRTANTSVYKKMDSYNGIYSIVLPEGITRIGEYAFADARFMSTLILPNTLTTIGDAAFCWATVYGLRNQLVIPEGVTSIGWSAFWQTGLRSIVLPKSLKTIGANAFGVSTDLANIYYRGTQSEWNAISKGVGWNEYDMGKSVSGGTKIHYNYKG